MRKLLSKVFIGTYLTALSLGIACHAMNFGLGKHPFIYFFVWDMFCGWSAHETRYHLIAEGESGNHYRLAPGPWGSFHPYGDLDRSQYDVVGNCHARIALNTLRQTEHEPMVRIFLIEESWTKKNNLSDDVWAMQFEEPRDPHSYFWHRATYDPDGNVMYHGPDYISYLLTQSIVDNPRLKSDSLRGKPFFAVDPSQRSIWTSTSVSVPESAGPVFEPSAN